MVAMLFPGQGSQRRGMGKGLFDEIDQYVAVEREVDAILGYSLRRLCLDDVDNRLKQTEFTQPALYVVNALHYYKSLREDVRPAYFAGHSLGEFNALLAGGAFDFLTGLRLVKKRGELMAQAKNGGMGAVIGMNASSVAKVIQEGGLSSIDVANFNSPLQIVVSGPVDDIKRAGPIFEKSGARMFMPLAVSAAFHSRYMAAASDELGRFLAPMSFGSLKTPVVSNVTAQLYPSLNASESIKHMLVSQMTHSVLWTQSVRFLIQQGVTTFTEVGAGNVLTKLVQQIQEQKDN